MRRAAGCHGKIAHRDLLATIAGFEPADERAVERVDVVLDDDHLLGLRRQRDDLALLAAEAGDVDALAVDRDEAVVHELAGLRTAGCPTGAVHDVVEALLEEAQQDLTRRPGEADGLFVRLVELLFEHAVDVLRLLLLLHLGEVLAAGVAATGAAVLAGRERATIECLAALFVLEDVGAEAARDAHLRSGVASHFLSFPLSALISRDGAWVDGNRCAVPG